ncbi:MAG: 50S ribosomal protein L21 [Parcubacteria group bacterium CG1_02_37_51]|uniref:Large ribosomal subunit protein bL21 n=2 Tax=Candidatus Komeiliibacteriota TaxID=1817908 RepID=A0A2M8DQL7_9BACT|nr:MAG: 50S ribosomal protein L21 [Parcubacteria group bacterium CG1_02_37_51]PIY94806.1 MAG: 50S ribosomal protein L21 [Candidatus Komeilibacteria bacterium CG_4_10_14_0_8_um_filter_37_78]PJC01405.1 MAG: 50S ribosomal protein L21 [Candidatus Komeilibacteria bacterium CG_4_9_14_0_8_um_filter_36_9]
MTLAVIKTGGKQYLVQKGDKLKVEKLVAEVGDQIELKDVLLKSDTKGSKVELGKPVLDTIVEAKVLQQARGKKIKVVKYKNKIRYKKTQGHRQAFTELEITKV